MLARIPLLPAETIVRRGAELVEVAVDGQTLELPRLQAGCLGGIFGSGWIEVRPEQQEDFLRLLHHPWPRYLVTAARHLVMAADLPADDRENVRLRYVLPREPRLALASHTFLASFLARPAWPEEDGRSAISRLHEIAYCCLSGAFSAGESYHWLHRNAPLVIQCLRNLRHARLFVPHSRYLAKHSYLHDVSLLLGIMLKAAGEEFMVTLALCGGQQFLQEVGLI
ncbi:MAG: hypothetical protein QHH02_01160 [Syntrophomonadaceae bacterium]|nr:hypothetical protein [Syntrophomonadaceae bacterium]